MLKLRLKQSVIERKQRISGPAVLRRHERILQRRQQKQNSALTSTYCAKLFNTICYVMYVCMYIKAKSKTEQNKRIQKLIVIVNEEYALKVLSMFENNNNKLYGKVSTKNNSMYVSSHFKLLFSMVINNCTVINFQL